jgi:hypothetical protein
MAKKAVRDSKRAKARRKAKPSGPPPARQLRAGKAPPELIEELRRLDRVAAEWWAPFNTPEMKEGRREIDRTLAIRDGLVKPSWLRQAPLVPEPKVDTAIVGDSTEPRVEDTPPPDKRQSRQGVRHAAAQRQRAQTVLTRLFSEHDYPLRSQVPDADLWRSFCVEWERGEGAQGVSLNLRPSRSTVMREVGRKD